MANPTDHSATEAANDVLAGGSAPLPRGGAEGEPRGAASPLPDAGVEPSKICISGIDCCCSSN
jgi:hypothetical protein